MPRELPSELEADRFFVRPRTRNGTDVRLFTDTARGLFLYASSAERLRLPCETIHVYGQEVRVVRLPEFDRGQWIPDLSVENDPRPPALRGRLLVRPDAKSRPDYGDGMLGQEWFGGRVWTFDYEQGRLLVGAAEGARPPQLCTITMRFPRDPRTGRATSHFASIDAVVGGKELPFLFDTGATVALTDHARSELAHDPPASGTCFVIASIFDHWCETSDWPVIDNADMNARGQPMIEVPEVTIARHTVGPVWFTRRPDANFHEWMSSMMDRRVDGALGGSLLRYFVVHADYPNARLSLERIE